PRTTARRSITGSPPPAAGRSAPRPPTSPNMRERCSRSCARWRREDPLMRAPTGIRRLFRLSLGRRGVEHAVADELRFHLDMRADELMRAGVPREQAIERATAEFGDVGEAHRELAAIGRRREARIARAEWW